MKNEPSIWKVHWWRRELTLLVTGTFFDGVTLSTLGPEDFVTGFDIAGRCLIERRHSQTKAKRIGENKRWKSCAENLQWRIDYSEHMHIYIWMRDGRVGNWIALATGLQTKASPNFFRWRGPFVAHQFWRKSSVIALTWGRSQVCHVICMKVITREYVSAQYWKANTCID